MNIYYQFALTKGYYNADASKSTTEGSTSQQLAEEETVAVLQESKPTIQTEQESKYPTQEKEPSTKPPLVGETQLASDDTIQASEPVTQLGDSGGESKEGTTVNIFTGGLGSTTGTYLDDTVSVDVPNLDVETGTSIGGGGGFGGGGLPMGKDDTSRTAAPIVKTIIPLIVMVVGVGVIVLKPFSK